MSDGTRPASSAAGESTAGATRPRGLLRSSVKDKAGGKTQPALVFARTTVGLLAVKGPISVRDARRAGGLKACLGSAGRLISLDDIIEPSRKAPLGEPHGSKA